MGHQDTQFCFRRFEQTSRNSTITKTKEEKTRYYEYSIRLTATLKHVNTCFKTRNYENFRVSATFFSLLRV